jgi:hypothetical protein
MKQSWNATWLPEKRQGGITRTEVLVHAQIRQDPGTTE